MTETATAKLRIPFYCSTAQSFTVRSAGIKVIAGIIDIVPIPEETKERCLEHAAEMGLTDLGDIVGLNYPNKLVQGWDALPDIEDKVLRFLLAQGLELTTKDMDMSLLACNSASFHTDVESFAGSAFCVVWLDDQPGFELLVPDAGARIPLSYGTTVFFDGATPHAVVPAGETTWDPEHPAFDAMTQSQLFLSYDVTVSVTGAFDVLGINDLGPLGESERLCPTLEDCSILWVDNATGAWDY